MPESLKLNSSTALLVIFLGVAGASLFDGRVLATVYCITGGSCVNFAAANAVHELDQPYPDMASCLAVCW
jgi:hypothetical protein